MGLRTTGIVFSSNENMTYRLREKCKSVGLDTSYTTSLNDLIAYCVSSKSEVVLIDTECDIYNDLIKTVLQHIESNNLYLFVSNIEVDGIDNKKTFVCAYDELDDTLPMLMLKPDIDTFSSKIPEELAYKYATELLLNFKFSPTKQGYAYMLQCIMLGIKYDNIHINLAKDIYLEVATKNNTTVANVEKAIRMSIKKAIQLNPEVFVVDGLSGKKITNATLINYFIINVKLKFINNNYDDKKIM